MTSKLASIHAGLVARKGEAMPALSNPGFSYVDSPRPVHETTARAQPRTAIAEPAGHRSPSHDNMAPALPISRTDTTSLKRKPARKDVEGEHPGPYKLTFRMTKDQRRRLRIAAAQRDLSLQQLLSEALDNHLDGLCACSLEACNCLARNEVHQN